MKLKLSEKDVRKQVNGYLKYVKCFKWWNLQGLGCYKGLPDIEGVLASGFHFYIELKSPTGTQSDEQIEFQKRVEEYGELYILARSSEDVEKAFNEVQART